MQPPVSPGAGAPGASASGAGASGANLVWAGMLRSLHRRCPNCDRGQLFQGYLKVQQSCPACGHDLAQYRADDAGPYFTVLLIGHLVVGPMLFLPFVWKAPVALVLGLTLPVVLGLTLVALPLVKGAVIGALWGMRLGRSAKAPPVLDHTW